MMRILIQATILMICSYLLQHDFFWTLEAIYNLFVDAFWFRDALHSVHILVICTLAIYKRNFAYLCIMVWIHMDAHEYIFTNSTKRVLLASSTSRGHQNLDFSSSIVHQSPMTAPRPSSSKGKSISRAITFGHKRGRGNCQFIYMISLQITHDEIHLLYFLMIF